MMRGLFQQWWRAVGWGAFGAVAATVVLTHQLGRLVPALSAREAAASVTPIFSQNPLFLPYKLLQLAIYHLPHLDPILAARLPSVVLALISLALFAYLTRRWYGKRSMVFGVALLLSSAWLLHSGRSAGYDSVYLAMILGVMSLHTLLHDHEQRRASWIVWGVGTGLILTLPGSIWLVVFSAGLQWRTIVAAWLARSITERTASILVIGTGLIWFGWRLTTNHLVAAWLGVPNEHSNFTAQIGRTFHDLVIMGPNDPTRWLPGTPVFDIVLLVMLLVGGVFYARHWQANRTHLVGGLGVISVLLSGLQPEFFSAVVVLCYLIIVSGTAFSLHQWLAVFPHNPLARGIGIGVMSLLVGLSCLYGLQSYFVAWPQARVTKSAYHLLMP